MMPISGVNTGAVQPLTATGRALGAPGIEKPGETAPGRQRKPVMDEYIPEERREPSGRYWMGKDEDGQPRIYFDDPERAADAPEGPEAAAGGKKADADVPGAEEPARNQGAKGPEKKGGKEERCVCNTDKVDREIERLKKRQKELEQRISAETDETRVRDLERQLAQVESELRQKDNDTYRKQHSTFTRLS